jgi:ATP-dependent helicase HrpB
MPRNIALPVDALLPAIVESLQSNPNLVLEAAPGAGKTTRVPPALLSLVAGEVIVLEPRRIAARMAARRVAAEMGEEVGGTVGYQVRFEERVSVRTRLRFVTEGILTRRLLSDPELRGVDAVVLDEFHERHLDSDLALALLKRLQRRRPSLRLVVMSATLDAAPIAAYLGGAAAPCPRLSSQGRAYPLTIVHTPYSPDPLAVQVRRAVEQLERAGHTGSTLVFLPGIAEIRRAMRECEGLAQRAGLLLLPLHGDLTPAEQDRAVQPGPQRKLILATNVAESSVTVEGVSAVIDSGLVRTASHSPWSGLPTLQIARISRASATQRAGRAGRTGPGQVIRLYPEEDLALRPAQDAPEIVRSDLAQLLLSQRVMGLESADGLDWLTPPPAEHLQAAQSLLERLGAQGSAADRMAQLPLHPRLARVVIEAVDRGVGELGCRAAALLSLSARAAKVDLLAELESGPLDPRLPQLTAQLLRSARVPRQARHDEDALLIALLAGFPDRVARRRSAGVRTATTAEQVMLCSGIAAELAHDVPGYEFLVALDAEDRTDSPMPLVRRTSRVEPEWLLELHGDVIEERRTVEWHRTGERVEQVNLLLYDKLVLEETRGPASADEAAALLAAKALENGVDRFLERFADPAAYAALVARVQSAGLELPAIEVVVTQLCQGLTRFSELRDAARALVPLLESAVDARRLQELAPASIRLGNGRQTKVHYEEDRAPWIASRLQDFFGMRETPRVGLGQTPVVVHLLAPNQRAVQTTTDLRGFWERLYPQVRRELMRRYRRHAWPEDPLHPQAGQRTPAGR